MGSALPVCPFKAIGCVSVEIRSVKAGGISWEFPLGGLRGNQRRWDSFSGPTRLDLRVEIVNPPYGFDITHFSEVSLSR
jgi:hypothetical protein